jgi:antitoxin component YwqK of YwqJK toxin-antitoxin module
MDKGWYIWAPVIAIILFLLIRQVVKAKKGEKSDTAFGCIAGLVLMGGLPLVLLFYCTSSIKWDGDYVDEFKDSVTREILIKKYSYLDGEYHGAYEVSFKKGGRHTSGQYDNGNKVGEWTWWHKNGEKSKQTNFSNYEPYRLETRWHDNGQKRSIVFYDENQSINTPKGMSWHKNGQKSREGSAHFALDGTESSWHENGQLAKVESWENQKLLRYEIYDKDGTPCPFTTYKDGSGVVAHYDFWNDFGEPGRITIYKNYEIVKVMDEN